MLDCRANWTRPSGLGIFFFVVVEWTVENCLKESVFSIDLLSAIKRQFSPFLSFSSLFFSLSLPLCEVFSLPKSKMQVHTCILLLDLNLINPVPKGWQPHVRPSMRTPSDCATWHTSGLYFAPSVRCRCTQCCSRNFWAIVWPGSICTTLLPPSQEAARLYPPWRTSQVGHGSNHHTTPHTQQRVLSAREMVEGSATEVTHWSSTSAASSAAFPSSSSPIPPVIARHASLYLAQLLPTNPPPPIRQLLWTNFPAKLFFFSFQWLNHDQEAVRCTEPQLAKEWGECPGELSVLITSDYLQFHPKDVEWGGGGA